MLTNKLKMVLALTLLKSMTFAAKIMKRFLRCKMSCGRYELNIAVMLHDPLLTSVKLSLIGTRFAILKTKFPIFNSMPAEKLTRC